MRKKFYMMLAVTATVMASLVATSACIFSFYQPEEPKSLLDE